MPRYDYWEQGDRIGALKRQPLFVNRLRGDIAAGSVFPAIRGGKIDFYVRGRKLCSYDGRAFRTNVAYLAAFQDRPSGEVTQEQFSRLKLCASFQDAYEQIKKNITLHEQPESGGVSRLCKAHSCFASGFAGPIGVFDIELSLEASEDDRSQDRIDLVLFHTEQHRLRFFEVKTLDNNEIWPNEDGPPDVCGQIARYKEQLTRRQRELMEGYKQYARLMADLCEVRLPEPNTLDTEPDLLLIGFDSHQQATITSVLVPAFGEGFCYCSIGDPKNATQNTLAKWWANR
jgi:hypothetical protein